MDASFLGDLSRREHHTRDVPVPRSNDVHVFLRSEADTHSYPTKESTDVQISFDTTQESYGVGPPPPPPRAAGMQTLATDLGVSADDLTTARQSGQSLSDFATSKGISQDTLLAAVKDSIQTNSPAGAPALSSDQLTAMASDMVGRKPGAGGGHHHHHAGQPVGAVQMPDSSLLGALSGTTSANGTSATDGTLTQLLQNLASSQGSDSSSDSSLEQVLQQLSSSTSSYGSDGSTPGLSGSLGLDALA
jgi:hypothetical protein